MLPSWRCLSLSGHSRQHRVHHGWEHHVGSAERLCRPVSQPHPWLQPVRSSGVHTPPPSCAAHVGYGAGARYSTVGYHETLFVCYSCVHLDLICDCRLSEENAVVTTIAGSEENPYVRQPTKLRYRPHWTTPLRSSSSALYMLCYIVSVFHSVSVIWLWTFKRMETHGLDLRFVWGQ